jgi:hypothetical protein
MKDRIMSILMSGTLVIFIMSANPTASQKQTPPNSLDTIPAKADSVKDVVSNDSLLEAASLKVDKAIKVVDQVGARVNRIEGNLNNLESRQYRIRQKLTPVQITNYNPKPRPATELVVRPDSVQIKPVEVHKASWWKRAFGRD